LVRPLVTVEVSIAGTEIRAITNNDGQYLLLNVPAGTHTVIATIIGYVQGRQQVELSAGETVTLDFSLRPSAVVLEGVTATASPMEAQRRELGHTIDVITAEEIELLGAVTLDEVLRGKAPGVTVQGSSGYAGAGSAILLRGLTSINARNRPLIYLDGVRMNDRGAYEGSGDTAEQGATVLNSISPEDIERIEILKGASASALYGTEASAGVIQIFTKRGTAGRPRWTFAIEQGWSSPRHVGPQSDPTGLHLNDCSFGGPLRLEQDTADLGCPPSGSWLQNAHKQDYRLNVRGGGETYSYYGSVRWGRTTGIINVPDQFDDQGADDFNLRGNMSFTPLNDLQIQFNSSYTRRDIQWYQDGDNSRGFTENVTKLDEGETPDNNDALVFQSDIEQDIDHFTTAVLFNWTPSSKFATRLNLGYDWSRSQTITFDELGYWDFADGSRTNDDEISRLITIDYAGAFRTPLSDSWTSALEWGFQLNDREDRGMRVDCIRFVAPGERVANECAEATFEGGGFGLQEDRRGFRTGGVPVQWRLGWKDLLFVTAGLRGDLFSQINNELDLTFDFNWYPKLAVSYSISDHDFWPDQMETFRLRAAWGQSGAPPPQDAQQTLWQIAGADELQGSGFIIETLSNPDIKPEKTSEIEAGLDLSAFNGRVSFQGSYFNAKTTDALIWNPLRPSDGVVENIPTNEAEWKRWGIEMLFDVSVIESPGYRLSLAGGYSWRDSEIISLGSLGEGTPQCVTTSFSTRFCEGAAFPQYWGEPVMNPNEFALPVRDTAQNLGTSIPTKELNLGLSFTFQERLTLEMYGAGQFGYILLDESAEELATAGVWPQCVGVDDNLTDHLDNGVPLEFTAAEIARCSSRSSVRLEDGTSVALRDRNVDWTFSGNYFRIGSASLTYRLPERWLPLGLTGTQLQFRVTNLALFTDYPTDTDPDALVGAATNELFRFSGYAVPAPRTYSFILRVNF
jgi:TonB-dependent SusC/RagA subfamily outer membrane receptor